MIWINAIALTFANFELRLIGQLQRACKSGLGKQVFLESLFNYKIIRHDKREPRPVAIRGVEPLRTRYRLPRRKAQCERHLLCSPWLRLHRYSDQSAR